jgi:hypothetical protein
MPPVAEDRVEVKPSLPATVMVVAFVAAIVRVDALPCVTVVGLAETVTVGLDGGGGAADTVTVAVAVAGVVPLAPVAVAV